MALIWASDRPAACRYLRSVLLSLRSVNAGRSSSPLPARPSALSRPASDVEVKVIGVCRDEGCIFVSRRAVLDSARLKALRRAILSGLKPGVPHLGKVTLVLPFRAFVDLGVGVFGVLPASEFAAPEEDRQQIKARNEPGRRDRWSGVVRPGGGGLR